MNKQEQNDKMVFKVAMSIGVSIIVLTLLLSGVIGG